MIPISLTPTKWKHLQSEVSRILTDSGINSESPKVIQTARGSVEVDVFGEDTSQKPTIVYIVECKNWQRNVPREVVHSFRTVMDDAGGNIGLLISAKGFQRGAFTAAKNTNIMLLTWLEFNELFIERWINCYMVPRVHDAVDPLVEYTEPVNSRIFRKAECFSDSQHGRFLKLRELFAGFAFYGSLIGFGAVLEKLAPLQINNLSVEGLVAKAEAPLVPAYVSDAKCLRDFTDRLISRIEEALEHFDELFGERA